MPSRQSTTRTIPRPQPRPLRRTQARRAARPAVRLVAVVLAALTVTLVVAAVGPLPTATAHSELLSSSPSAGDRLTAPPEEIRLVFTEKVEDRFATVTVSVDGSAAQTLTSRVDGAIITATPPERVPAATQAWTVAYRIVSTDGHPVSGAIDFAVASAGSSPTSSSSASSPALPTPTSPAADPEPPRVNRLWPLVVIGVLSLIAGPIAVALLGVRSERAIPTDADRDPPEDVDAGPPDEPETGDHVDAGPPDDAASGDDSPAPPQPRTDHARDR